MSKSQARKKRDELTAEANARNAARTDPDITFGQFLLQPPDGLGHDAVGGVGAGGPVVLGIGNAEQEDGGDAEFVRAGGFADQFIGRELENAGHGVDGAADFAAGADEQGQDELRGTEAGFADHAAQGGRLAQAAEAGGGKLCGVTRVHADTVNSKAKLQSAKLFIPALQTAANG